jgi:pyruvate dehydrogenase E2 component (dihydrolipoamide acetyltransferase)
MAFEFKFPDIGEGLTEGEIVRWLVKEGDEITEGQPLVEVETDKALAEIPSPKTGVVLKILAREKEIVKVGQVIVVFGEKGEALTAPPPQPKSVGVVGEKDVRRVAEGKEKPVEEVKKPTKVKKYDLYGYVERIPLKGVRRSIAKAMVKSMYTAPHVTAMDEADVTALWKIREKEKKAAEKKGTKLTILPFIIKGVIAGLSEHPYLNASLDDENEEIILKKYFNIGVATDTPEGLMVPVVKNAKDKSILQLAQELTQLAEKARNRTIDLADLKGGTFTVSNYGALGGIYATPIINYPEVAILGVGKIKDTPVVRNGKLVVRKILSLALSFDHRVVDGGEGARFLNTVIARLEDPDLILLET